MGDKENSISEDSLPKIPHPANNNMGRSVDQDENDLNYLDLNDPDSLFPVTFTGNKDDNPSKILENMDKQTQRLILKLYDDFLVIEECNARGRSLDTLQVMAESVQSESNIDTQDFNIQDFQEKLLKVTSDQELKLNKETLVDYKKIAKALKAQSNSKIEKLGHEVDGIEDALTKTRKQLSETSVQEQIENLNSRMIELEKDKNSKIKESAEEQALLEQQDYIHKQESLARFYWVLKGGINHVIAECCGIALKTRSRPALSGNEIKMNYISMAGERFPVNGVKAFLSFFMYPFQKKAKRTVDNRARDVAEQTDGPLTADKLAGEVALQLTLMYEEQILQLDLENSTVLARSATILILKYLWNNDLKEDDLSTQLIQIVACIKVENESWYEKLKDKKDSFSDKKLTTKFRKEWTASKVFQRPGIEVKDKAPPLYYEAGRTNPGIYGYRLGSEEEAKKANLSVSNRRVATELTTKRFTPNQRLSSVTPLFKQASNTNNTLLHVAPHVTKQVEPPQRYAAPSQTDSLHEPAIGVTISGLKVTLTLTSIPSNKRDTVSKLMEDYSQNCRAGNVHRNGNGKIIELELSLPSQVKKLEEELLAILKPVTGNTPSSESTRYDM